MRWGFHMLPANKIHPESFHGQFYRALSDLNDGSMGKYRAPLKFLLIDIKSDADAIEVYCSSYAKPSSTRFMHSVLERLQMWAVLVRKKALSDLGLEDYRAYIAFLQDPPFDWISQRQNKKGSLDWRPFTSLNRTDEARKITKRTNSNCLIIRQFIRWMNDAGYLISNPMSLAMAEVQAPKTVFASKDPAVAFPGENIMLYLWAANHAFPYNPEYKKFYEPRAELIMCLLYHHNVHISDMPMARMADFKCIDDAWFFCSNADHQRSFKIPIGLNTLDAFREWRLALGLDYYPSSTEDYALFPPIHRYGTPMLKRSGLSIDSINNCLIGILRLAGLQMAEVQPVLAERLSVATSSWIRFKGQRDRKDGTYYRYHHDDLYNGHHRPYRPNQA